MLDFWTIYHRTCTLRHVHLSISHVIFSESCLSNSDLRSGVVTERVRFERWRTHNVRCSFRSVEPFKTDGSTRLTYTGLRGELEHLKIETRLIGESFECVEAMCDPSIFRLILSVSALARMLSTLDLICEENDPWWKWKYFYY